MTYGKKWTKEEECLANDLRSDGMTFDEIAKVIGRSCNSVSKKFYYVPTPNWLHTDGSISVPDSVSSDRLRRGAKRPHDLTAALCGDPLPGYSALDKRERRA